MATRRSSYRPPFDITPRSVDKTAEIMRLVGRYEGMLGPRPEPKLRRQNRIRTIQGSLAIEGNSLDIEQITAILDDKRVFGPVRDVLEVKNAIEAYSRAAKTDPGKSKALLAMHHTMMKGLISDAGRYRAGGVGVVRGSKIAHVAPPAHRVPVLVDDLLSFLAADRSVHPLILSAIVHYELEFIHPFSDGNGRIGRLWQHVVLVRFHPLFEYVPIESLVHREQKEYYRALGACDEAGSSTMFVEFSLGVVKQALEAFLEDARFEPSTADTRLEFARREFGRKEFSRRDYLRRFNSLSTATASRDLRQGVDEGILTRTGEKASTKYRFR
jgi:Fic family protein